MEQLLEFFKITGPWAAGILGTWIILNIIGEGEGFNWKYKNGVHNSRKEFEEDIIIFNNKTLNTKYKLEGLTRKEAKKK